ncbi:peptide deformylase, partial [Anoxybacillus sp. LAT27]
DRHGRIELINPIIIAQSGEQIGPEGCLSFPGLFGEVKRFQYVKVRAQNRRGRPFEIEATGFLARALQHEIDHLHGIL